MIAELFSTFRRATGHPGRRYSYRRLILLIGAGVLLWLPLAPGARYLEQGIFRPAGLETADAP